MPKYSQRYLCRQLLHNNNVHLHVTQHELYRLLNVDGKAALTDKEKAHLKRGIEDLKKATDRLGKLGIHIQGSL